MNQTYIITADDNSNLKLFQLVAINMVKETKMQAPKNTWYLDLCVSHYLINNKDLFINNLPLEYLDFTIARGFVFCRKSIGTIAIFFLDRSSIILCNVAYALNYYSYLILLNQFCKSSITYIDNIEDITLVKSK